MIKSALRHIEILEDLNFYDIKLSLKSSDVVTTINAYKKVSNLIDYPLHLVVTEAGTLKSGLIKSSVGLGTLLYEGIGDTIRVSLTENPVEEVEVRVEYEQNGEVFDSVFHEENLDRKDQYTYYLDGNHSIVEIETSNSQAPSLLVIADSYSHLMIPYLISDFSRIQVVDLRYYRNVISDHSEEFDQILVLYSLENLSEDDGLSWLR